MGTLIELELINDTPVFIGGYDTQCHKWDIFRTQSLKGLWRWWLRAYIMGALFENGLLNFKTGRQTLTELAKNTIDLIRKITGSLLGSTESSSKFRIVITDKTFGEILTCPGKRDKIEKKDVPYCNCQRVKLLTIGNRSVTYVSDVKVKLAISQRLSREKLSDREIRIGIGSLLTALALNGIGKMGRRGLGTFTVRLIRDNTNMFSEYFRSDGTFNLDKLPDLIKHTLKECREYVQDFVKAVSSQTPPDIPPCDIITDRKIQYSLKAGNITEVIDREIVYFRQSTSAQIPITTIYEVKWRNKRIHDVCTELQDFFYRPGRIRRFYGSPNTPYGHWQCMITASRCAWLFGLPRKQHNTGYIADIDRRASPIHLAVHRDRAYFTIFLSLDWPSRIIWNGSSRMNINVNRNSIIGCYIIIIDFLRNYLQRLKYSFKVIHP